MSETKTVWHPYPEEKPFSEYENINIHAFINMEVPYICTIERHNGTFVVELTWRPFFKKFERMYWIDDIDKYVMAWAEMPEPYKEEI